MNTLQRLHAEQDQSPWIDFIDRQLIDTGKLAEPGCPRVIREAFLAGTEPTDVCELHRF